jgi:heme exporter protein A
VLFRDLRLQVPAGCVVWLRGRNGRGKTSLLRLAAGLSTPESGAVLWGDAPLRRTPAARRQLLYIGHANALKEDLSVTEALDFLVRLHGGAADPAALQHALAQFGLLSRRDAMVRTLSQGQHRRVALARLAIAQEPALWILDEPFDALDADGCAALLALLDAHRRRGGSVLLTSHLPLDRDALEATVFDLDAAEVA